MNTERRIQEGEIKYDPFAAVKDYLSQPKSSGNPMIDEIRELSRTMLNGRITLEEMKRLRVLAVHCAAALQQAHEGRWGGAELSRAMYALVEAIGLDKDATGGIHYAEIIRAAVTTIKDLEKNGGIGLRESALELAERRGYRAAPILATDIILATLVQNSEKEEKVQPYDTRNPEFAEAMHDLAIEVDLDEHMIPGMSDAYIARVARERIKELEAEQRGSLVDQIDMIERLCQLIGIDEISDELTLNERLDICVNTLQRREHEKQEVKRQTVVHAAYLAQNMQAEVQKLTDEYGEGILDAKLPEGMSSPGSTRVRRDLDSLSGCDAVVHDTREKGVTGGSELRGF